MAVTLKEIAAHVGVSKQAVSAVLTGTNSSRVSAEKRLRILEAVKKFEYRPNQLARALVEKRTYTLGFINGDIGSSYHAHLTEEMLIAAEKRGYKLLLLVTHWSREKELACLEQMLDYQVDGIIVNSMALRNDDSSIRRIRRDNIPFVLLGGTLEGLCSVCFDFLPGMTEAFELLAHTGHQRIAIADTGDSDKITAYRDCCRKFYCTPRIYQYGTVSRYDYQQIMDCGRKIAAEQIRPEALIAGNDEAAGMLIKGLAAGGVRVPEDMSLIGHDGTYLQEILQPTLTDIIFDYTATVEATTDYLIARIENPECFVPQKKLIPTRLVIRESVIDRTLNIKR